MATMTMTPIEKIREMLKSQRLTNLRRFNVGLEAAKDDASYKIAELTFEGGTQHAVLRSELSAEDAASIREQLDAQHKG